MVGEGGSLSATNRAPVTGLACDGLATEANGAGAGGGEATAAG